MLFLATKRGILLTFDLFRSCVLGRTENRDTKQWCLVQIKSLKYISYSSRADMTIYTFSLRKARTEGSSLTRRRVFSIYYLTQEYKLNTFTGNEAKYLCLTLKYRNSTKEFRVEGTNASS